MQKVSNFIDPLNIGVSSNNLKQMKKQMAAIKTKVGGLKRQ